MRALILALSVLGIFLGADAAKAGPTTARDPAVDPATLPMKQRRIRRIGSASTRQSAAPSGAS